MAGVYDSVQALSMSGSATVPPDFVRSAQDQPAGPDAFRGDPRPPPPPVIDMSRPDCGALVADAATEWGLFQVVNHGVPAAAVSELQRVGRAFFALPREEKQQQHCTCAGTGTGSSSIEGYGIGVTGPRGSSRDAEGKKNWEDYLFHYVAPPAVVNHGVWPNSPAGYREANEEYCRHVQRLTRELFGHLSLGLGLEEGAVSEAFGGGDRMVLLQKICCYPPCPQPELALGVGPHTDMCAVTVLLPDDVEGLQVFKDGRWHDVQHVPQALVVFMGDQIEILSNGRYKAAKHRVTVNKEKTRMSWPMFVEPPGELAVGPHQQLAGGDSTARYKPKKYKDYQFCKSNLLPQ